MLFQFLLGKALRILHAYAFDENAYAFQRYCKSMCYTMWLLSIYVERNKPRV